MTLSAKINTTICIMKYLVLRKLETDVTLQEGKVRLIILGTKDLKLILLKILQTHIEYIEPFLNNSFFLNFSLFHFQILQQVTKPPTARLPETSS